jgi:hypothetical protein
MSDPNNVAAICVNGVVSTPCKKVKADVEMKKTITQIVKDAPKLKE